MKYRQKPPWLRPAVECMGKPAHRSSTVQALERAQHIFNLVMAAGSRYHSMERHGAFRFLNFFFLFVLRFGTFLLLIAAMFCFSLLRTGRATNLDCRVVQLAAKRGRCRGRAVSFYLLFNQQNERNSFVNTSCTVYVHCRVFSPAYWLSSPRFS